MKKTALSHTSKSASDPDNQKTTALSYPFAKIKDLWLEVANCDFYHSHLGQKEGNFFLGRKKAKERLKMLLRQSKSRSGAYLVTGFRGMGKTSLVHEALRELKGKNFEAISISMSQDDVRDLDVLRLIARQLASKWKELYLQKSFWRIVPPWALVLAMAVFFLVPFIVLGMPDLLHLAKWSHHIDWFWAVLSRLKWWYLGSGSLVLVLVLVFINYLHNKVYKQIFGGKNYSGIQQRLDFLNSRLDTMITQDRGLSVSPEALNLSLFNVSSKTTQSYQIATPKEIEKELIGIFNDIDKYRNEDEEDKKPHWWQKTAVSRFFRIIHQVPEFVFILDELDKIEPEFITSRSPAEGEAHTATISRNVQRREAIDRLLSSLKSFLNEAKAKFIFIGGREMYDASLADIADRETFYGSIFHAVIYLNSFFKDKIQHRSGITRLTEAYLCHQLIPDWYLDAYIASHPDSGKDIDKGEWYSLETMYHYLVDCQRKSTDDSNHSEYQYWKAKFAIEKATLMEREAAYKIIYLLQNFVIFLTYRSSGTPKKLAGLFENFVVVGKAVRTPADGLHGRYLFDEKSGNDIVLFCPPEPATSEKDVKVYTPWAWHGWQQSSSHRAIARMQLPHQCEGKLFLKFNFNQQYEIGLTSNLYRPYVIIHSRYMKALGDKLLFSSSYIMDYILKFHPHGFSWRNLEMIPDIILTNKDPNLRSFMQDLVQFLSRMHIRETVNGMFQYRFFSKVTNEIRFLSKISEQGAAAFNFTLDESQQIKHFYRDKLHQQLKQHEEPVRLSSGNTPFIHSIAFLHNLLGDLHYYDKEYDDAIIHYSDAAQPLREQVASGSLTRHQVVLLVRTQLKLGMALERIRAFDSAYSIYRSLITDTPRLLKPRRMANEPEEKEGDMVLSRMQLFMRPHIAILDLIEKQRTDGITFFNLSKNIADLNTLLDRGRQYPILEPIKEDKQKSPGRDKDLPRLNTLYSDYFSNVGSILYFKNFNFPEVYKAFKKEFKELRDANLAEFIQKHRGKYKGEKGDADRILFDYNPSLSGYIYYRQAIGEQVATFREGVEDALTAAGKMGHFELEPGNCLQEAILMLHPATGYLTNSMQMFIMGNLFSKLGDAVLSSAGGNVKPLSKEILDIYEYDDSVGNLNRLLVDCLNGICREDFPFEDSLNSALLLFRISGLFYLKSNRSFSCAFQFKKFLFVVKDWLAFRGRSWVDSKDVSEENREQEKQSRKALLARLNKLLIEDIDKGSPSIASRLFRSIVWSSDVANRPQLLKYREILNLERTQDTTSIYNNISTSPEMREVVLLIEEIRLKLACLGILDSPLYLNLITPYDSISSKYLRVMELKYKCEYNFVRLKDMKAEKLLIIDYYKRKPPSNKPQKLLKRLKKTKYDVQVEDCVLDSIFCLYEVIRSLNIYGTNYVTNHSFLANAHYKLANWCRAFHNLRFFQVEQFEAKHGLGKGSWEARQEGQRFDDKLIKLLGTDALFALEPNYHNEQAIDHYYSAIQTHKGGRSYRDNVTNMSFLEDDLNDNLTHFSAAAERFRINTGVIRAKIGKLKQQTSGSQVYVFESYVGTP